MQEIHVQEKYLLSIQEASKYFSIGIKNMRRLAENHTDFFAIRHGNRYLIIREKCEEYFLGCLEKKNGGVEIIGEPEVKEVVEGKEEKGKEEKGKEENDKAAKSKGKKSKRQKREE